MIGVQTLKRAAVCVAVAGALSVMVGVGPAYGGSVWWGLTSGSWPSTLPPSGKGKVIVTAQNRGYADAHGNVVPIVLRDTLPAGLKATAVEGIAGQNAHFVRSGGALKCSLASQHEGECRFEGKDLPPFEELEMRVSVEVAKDAASGETNSLSVSGGEIPENSLARAVSIGEETQYGIEDYELVPEEEGGVPSTQAGIHPFQLTSVLGLNTSVLAHETEKQEPAALTKDLTFQLPPGLIGNPTVMAQCTDAEFNKELVEIFGADECSARTAIGTATITGNLPGVAGFTTKTVPLFNLTPLAGEPARFGFQVLPGIASILDTSVRAGGDYGVTVRVTNVTQAAGFMVSKVTFWGVPGDPRHDAARGWACIEQLASCQPADETHPEPLLSLPTACTGPMRTTVQANSWVEPKPSHPLEAPLFGEYTIGGLDGCNHLPFNPEISVAPDVPDASTPTGLEVSVHLPQLAALNPGGLAESSLRDTTVVLPAGVAVNPAGAGGLQACPEGLAGYLGKESMEPNVQLFTPVIDSPFCPDASKIGTVEIETPLLPHALKGAVYLAEQDQNPFGSLIAMYLVADDPVSGTILKLAGKVSLCEEAGEILDGAKCEAPGQLVSTFKDTPDLPFENLRLHFFGESRAPLGTPALCGAYTTGAVFAPWSGSAPSSVNSTFNITSGPNGSPCPNPPGDQSPTTLPFSPSLTAGTTSIQAGGFSPFTMTMTRADGNQNLKGVRLNMPLGLLGTLSSVKLCEEQQANAGTCGPESLIGHTIVSVGLGGDPYSVTGGEVFITGPYDGAPYGLSILNPAKAGPFDLGTVVVRAKIEVDPLTAALTVTTDGSGIHSIPTMLDGIPLQIQHINVSIDRPGFTFNPTSCEKLQVGGSLTSDQGATAGLTVPFQVTNCAILGFKPKLVVTTSGKPSRKNGTSLNLKLTYPTGAMGKEAWFRTAKFDFPKQLPARLNTLQQACAAETFASNPAACPSGSRAGTAVVSTPVLPNLLHGVVYFVSHGGAGFPEAVIVLQGDGVTVDLHTETFISKAGVTSATLRSIPGVPFNSVEVNLPSGPFSEFAATGNPCIQKLSMPIGFTAQNGLAVHQNTPIGVTGCPKHKNKHAKKAKAKTNNKRKH